MDHQPFAPFHDGGAAFNNMVEVGVFIMIQLSDVEKTVLKLANGRGFVLSNKIFEL